MSGSTKQQCDRVLAAPHNVEDVRGRRQRGHVRRRMGERRRRRANGDLAARDRAVEGRGRLADQRRIESTPRIAWCPWAVETLKNRFVNIIVDYP